jgi:hypothetical protein
MAKKRSSRPNRRTARERRAKKEAERSAGAAILPESGGQGGNPEIGLTVRAETELERQAIAHFWGATRDPAKLAQVFDRNAAIAANPRSTARNVGICSRNVIAIVAQVMEQEKRDAEKTRRESGQPDQVVEVQGNVKHELSAADIIADLGIYLGIFQAAFDAWPCPSPVAISSNGHSKPLDAAPPPS